MDVLIPTAAIPAAVIFASLWMWWTFSKSSAMLNRWATENGYTVISAQFRWIHRGPFFLISSRGQVVYYTVFQTPDGHTKKAWVRCGGFVLGLFTERVDVIWE